MDVSSLIASVLYFLLVSVAHVQFHLSYWRSQMMDQCTTSLQLFLLLAVVVLCGSAIPVFLALPKSSLSLSSLLLPLNCLQKCMYFGSWSCDQNTGAFFSSQYLTTLSPYPSAPELMHWSIVSVVFGTSSLDESCIEVEFKYLYHLALGLNSCPQSHSS